MIAAAGNLAKARYNASVMLADAAAWRTLVGASTHAQALERIHDCGLPPPADGSAFTREELEVHRPHAILFTSPEDGYTKTADGIGSSYDFAESGEILIDLEVGVAAEIANNIGLVMATAENTIGEILDDLAGLAGQATYLAALELSLVEGPYRCELEDVAEQGDHWSALLRLRWGTPS